MNPNQKRVGMSVAAVLLSAVICPAALAQGTGSTAASGGAAASRNTPASARENLMRLQRAMTVDLNETRLEDVLKFIADQTGAQFEILWKSDTENEGLDKEMLITVGVKGLPALTLLEKVLEKAQDGLTENSWQMTEYGAIQISSKPRLNKYKRVEIYDVNDLLFVLPQYANAPQVDLEKVLQSSGGKGGGGSQGSPFKNNNENQKNEPEKKEVRAREIIDIIVQIVDPPQWSDNGGEGGSITYKEVFSGQLIVNAADYLHRQLNGYKWWPSFRTGTSQGKRYVSLNLDTQTNQLDRPIRTLPVTATAGGTSGGPGTPPPGGG
jgi:hypothetical protein